MIIIIITTTLDSLSLSIINKQLRKRHQLYYFVLND